MAMHCTHSPVSVDTNISECQSDMPINQLAHSQRVSLLCRTSFVRNMWSVDVNGQSFDFRVVSSDAFGEVQFSVRSLPISTFRVVSMRHIRFFMLCKVHLGTCSLEVSWLFHSVGRCEPVLHSARQQNNICRPCAKVDAVIAQHLEKVRGLGSSRKYDTGLFSKGMAPGARTRASAGAQSHLRFARRGSVVSASVSGTMFSWFGHCAGTATEPRPGRHCFLVLQNQGLPLGTCSNVARAILRSPCIWGHSR